MNDDVGSFGSISGQVWKLDVFDVDAYSLQLLTKKIECSAYRTSLIFFDNFWFILSTLLQLLYPPPLLPLRHDMTFAVDWTDCTTNYLSTPPPLPSSSDWWFLLQASQFSSPVVISFTGSICQNVSQFRVKGAISHNYGQEWTDRKTAVHSQVEHVNVDVNTWGGGVAELVERRSQ